MMLNASTTSTRDARKEAETAGPNITQEDIAIPRGPHWFPMPWRRNLLLPSAKAFGRSHQPGGAVMGDFIPVNCANANKPEGGSRQADRDGASVS
jgi:hypothetical protein